MRDWYKAGDKKYKALESENARIFRKSRLTLDFDHINQPVKTIQAEAKSVYRKLKKKSDKAYLDIGLLVYMEAFEEAITAETKPLKAKDTEPEVGLPVSEISPKSKNAITKKWLNRFHREYNPVTKYVYENELERKQARFFESIVADVEAKDRHGMEADYKTAENAWKRQTRQAMIDTEDRAAITAYRDAGVEEVMWITQRDEHVCEECIARNGLIFPVDHVPDKPHYGCRCYIVPVKKQSDVSTEIDELTPCLRKNSTGELVKTKFRKISPTRSKFSKWLFDWTQPEKNGYTVYALTAEGDNRIQGLIATRKEQGYIDVDIVEAAPQNNPKNAVYFSGEKEYNGVGGHLFAEACRQSFEAGYDGFIAFTAKTNLIDYYEKNLGAVPLWAGSQRMAIEPENALKLIERYFGGVENV